MAEAETGRGDPSADSIRKVIDELQKDDKTLNRSEDTKGNYIQKLSKKLGISRPALYRVVDFLEDTGLGETEKRDGRRYIRLSFEPRRKH